MMKDNRYKLTKEDFFSLSNQINEMTPKIIQLSKTAKKIIACVGPTGSGKSTIISLLLGASLQFQQFQKGKWKVDHNNTSGQYPIIGHDKQSCTIFPKIYEANNKAYLDLAGWFDTRTPKAQIINGLSNSMVFTSGKQVKIMIVVECSQLYVQKGGVLVQIVDRLVQLFQQDFLAIMNSIVLIISKVKTDQWKMQDIKTQIREICKKNLNLKQNTKHLLTTLVQKQRIAIFPKLQKTQNLDDYVQEIKRQVFQIKGCTLTHGGCVTLSDKVINIIDECLQHLNKELNLMSKNIGIQLSNKLTQKNFTNGQQANKQLSQLNIAKTILEKQLSQCGNLEQYQKLLNQFVTKLSLKKAVTNDIKRNFNMINFYLKINKRAKIQPGFIQIIRSSLLSSILKIQQIRDKLVNEEEKKIMQERFEKQMKLREQKNIQISNELKKQKMRQLQEKERDIKQNQIIFQEQMKNNKDLKQKLERQILQVKKQNQSKVVIEEKEQSSGFSGFLKGLGQTLSTAVTMITNPITKIFKSKPSKYDEDDGEW